MSILRYFRKMELLDSFIRRKATGKQQEFAKKAGMSRALLNIYLSEMKELGFPICYSRTKNTYYYEEEGRIVTSLFEKTISEEELKQYKGGEAHQGSSELLFFIDDAWQPQPVQLY